MGYEDKTPAGSHGRSGSVHKDLDELIKSYWGFQGFKDGIPCGWCACDLGRNWGELKVKAVGDVLNPVAGCIPCKC